MEKSTYHIPVLTNEVLEYLDPQPGKVYVDATFGGGSHTRAILKKEPKCTVIAFDWDTIALEKNRESIEEEFPGRVKFIWGNFAHIIRILQKEKIGKVDGVLADFGTSQYQIHQRAGFSFATDTPLDMRMSPSHQKVTASDIVNRASEKELAEIFWLYGEERFSRHVARAIVEYRKTERIKTTAQLVDIIGKIISRKGKKIHPSTKVFQALRIVVNKELENIASFLKASIKVVKPGGRIVCISFHSLEDRLVKQFFKQETLGLATVKILTKKVVTASPEELEENRASRSARLRAAEVL